MTLARGERVRSRHHGRSYPHGCWLAALALAAATAAAAAPPPAAAPPAAAPPAAAPPAAAPPAAALGADTAAASAAPSPALDDVLRLLAARRHRRASFHERHYIAMLERPLESSGELVYDAPDHLEKRTLTPRPEILILDQGELIVERGHRRRVLPLRDYPQAAPFVESLRATLAGDRAALERYFRVEFAGNLDHWTLRLTPAGERLTSTVRRVTLTGERASIDSVEILQADGARSVLTTGPELPP